MWGWLDGIVDGITSLKESVLGIPGLIVDGIKDIFVPDADYIDNAFNTFVDELKMKFSLDYGAFENLFTSEKAVDDVYADYSINGIGNLRLKVFDSSFFVQGVTYFRPFVRGFLVLLMLLYHVRQLLGFFGYNAGVVAGRTDDIASNLKEQRKNG